MRYFLFVCFYLSIALPTSAQDTTTLFFATGKSDLTSRSKQTIDSFLYYSKLSLITPTHIYGYTDSVGDTSYNNELSYKRAHSVRKYLIQSGIEEKYILTIVGLGERSMPQATGGDYNLDRRVDIIRDVNLRTTETNILDAKTFRKGETIVLNNINFFANTTKFKPEAYEALTHLIKILTENRTLKIQLQGHTCCSYNVEPKIHEHFLNLSTYRAREVRSYLIGKGIDPSRMIYKGFGGSKPKIYPEVTKEDRYKNMRVEIRILDI